MLKVLSYADFKDKNTKVYVVWKSLGIRKEWERLSLIFKEHGRLWKTFKDADRLLNILKDSENYRPIGKVVESRIWNLVSRSLCTDLLGKKQTYSILGIERH